MDEDRYARKAAEWEAKAARKAAEWEAKAARKAAEWEAKASGRAAEWEDSAERLRSEIEQKAARWETKRESKARRQACRSGGGGLVVGGIIVVAGLVLLLDNMGIIRSHDIWRFWPLALVAVGLSRILESHRPAALVWGGMIAAVGALLFLDNVGILLFDFHMLWPLVIIAFGVSMFLRAMDRGRAVSGTGEEPVSGNPTVSLFAIFGGSKRQVRTPDFRGGEAFAFCGGFHVDLRGAQMPAGRAVFDVNTIFGGCEMIVPDSWKVTVQAMGVFGGVEDKTVQPRPVEGVQIPELIVTGAAVFGGIAIRN